MTTYLSCSRYFAALLSMILAVSCAHVHAMAVESDSQPIRIYRFDKMAPEATAVENEAGEAATIKYSGAEQIEIGKGSVEGRTAVWLDRDPLSAEAFTVDPAVGFSVSMRVKIDGPGKQPGNIPQTNGMLFAMGDGYWSGTRCYVDFRSGRVNFQIGRPKPSSAISCSTDRAIPLGVWVDLATVWDGKTMRVYIDGLPAGEHEFAGPFPAPNGSLKIGYAGAGVGSCRLAVESAAFYRGALSQAEVLRDARDGLTLNPETMRQFELYLQLVESGEIDRSKEAVGRMANYASLPSSYLIIARMALAQKLRSLGRNSEAIQQFLAVYNDAEATTSERRKAALQCMPGQQGATSADAPVDVYRTLLRQEGLNTTQKYRITVALAEALFRQEKFDESTDILFQLSTSDTLTTLQFADVCARLAESAKRGSRTLDEIKEKLAAMDAQAEKLKVNDLFRTYMSLSKSAFEGGWKESPRDIIDDWAIVQAAKTEPKSTSRAFYVAADGDDKNPGTIDQPFASLQAARDAIRKLRVDSTEPLVTDVTVLIRGGTYNVSETFSLQPQDSGTRKSSVIYRAYRDERPVFTGGVTLKSFTNVDDPKILARLPEVARGQVVRCDLRAAGIENPGEPSVRGMGCARYGVRPWVDLYVDNQPMTLARWPNDGDAELTVGEVFSGAMKTPEASRPGSFAFSHDRLDRWTKAENPWMEGKWGHLWAARTVPVEHIDRTAGKIDAGAGSGYGFRAGQPFHFINLLEEIDTPGEWWIDRDAGILYFWPPEGVTLESLAAGTTRVEMPVLEKPMLEMRGVKNVAFVGLTFESSRVDGIGMFDCNDCLVLGCTVQRLGGGAISVLGGQFVAIASCDLKQLGAGGVILNGGDRSAQTPGMHYALNCHIEGFSRVDRSYAPAIQVEGVGHVVAHCLMNDSPHHAMRIEGDCHSIAMNEIHSVVYEYDDQAGLDMWGDPTYRGNSIVFNYWHHIGSGLDVAGQSGIRLDDYISGVLIYGNIFFRSDGGRFGGVQIHGGKENVVLRNLFLDDKYTLSFSQWGDRRWLESIAQPSMQAKIARGLKSEWHRKQFPELEDLESHPDRNFIVENVSVACRQHVARDRGVNVYMGNNMYDGDWIDFEKIRSTEDIAKAFKAAPADLHRRASDPLEALPLMGPYKDSYRPTWPPVHSISSRWHSREADAD